MSPPDIKKRHAALALFILFLFSVPHAGAQVGNGFGRNKVQYRNFRWSVLSSEHFDIHYYEEERPLAIRTARMAERSYDLLSDALNYEIEDRIPLILYTSHNDFQQTNTVGGIIPEGVQGITESLKHRVILPFTGSYAQFNHVLTHELVHAFQFDVMSHSERRVNPLQRSIPLWFMEGMAEYLSVGMDKGTESWIIDALQNDRLISVSELNALGDIRVYRFGQALWYFIAETYGDEAVGRLLDRAFFHGSVDKAFLEIIELEAEEMTGLWHQWLRENFASTRERKNVDETASRLTHHTGYFYNLNLIPALSPDGTKMAYLSNKSLYNDVIIQELGEKGREKVVVNGGRSGTFESLRFLDTQISWSPDGTRIALVGESGGRDAIFIVNAESGSIVERISPEMSAVISPTWSPDGERLVFTGIRSGQSDLYLINRSGGGLIQLTDDVYSDLQPRWSPDGKSIVFASDRGSDTDLDRLVFSSLEIAVYDLFTERVDLLTNVKEDCHNPVWSPDGQQIAFISPLEGPPNIYAINRAGEELVRLTDLETGVGGITPTSPAMSWSQESNAIAFSSFSNSGWDIFLLENPETEAAREISEESDHWRHIDYTAYPLPGEEEIAEEAYRSRFAPDLLVGGVGYSNNVGVAGQSYILISDMLGNRNFVLSTEIYGSISESDLLFSYIDLTRRTNYALSAFQIRNDFGLFTARDSAEFLSQIYRGGGITFSRPFNMFSRLEYGAHAIIVEEDVFSQSFVTNEILADSSSINFFVNPMVAFVKDNSLYGSTGPIAGRRFRLQAEGGFGQINYTTLTADYRWYLNFARRYTLAYRLIGAASFGDNKQIFRIGGPYTFRGTDFGEVEGTRIVLQNIEFRFPPLFWLPPTYDFLKLALFWDMAAAWEDEFRPFTRDGTGFVRLRDLQGAYGAGARIGLGYLIVRFDMAQGTDLRGHIGSMRGFFSIGADY